jgi:cobalt/nickel transport system permease protein
MHMADALISPVVGGTVWAVTAGLIGYCARKVRQTLNDSLVPMMGVLGAFIFAAQMINFAIPGTGSSGHLGGGLILAILLGPHAAFLTLASVLTVQAFFFADGGLLALGCNIFNLGFFPAFVAYPLIYRVVAGDGAGRGRVWAGTLLAAVVGLQFGAFGVVMETCLSGISELPFRAFVLVMQPIHLAIGIVEGLVTVALVGFVAKARPEALMTAGKTKENVRPVLVGLLVAAIVLGGVGSWLASSQPDGLEWAIGRLRGKEAVGEAQDGIHGRLAAMQAKTALLPDYGFKGDDPHAQAKAGISVSGLVGGGMVLAVVLTVGVVLKSRGKGKSRIQEPEERIQQ